MLFRQMFSSVPVTMVEGFGSSYWCPNPQKGRTFAPVYQNMLWMSVTAAMFQGTSAE